MYLKYTTGFLIASLVQAGIIMTTEALGISNLDAKLTLMQLLTHILAGQIVGYLLLYLLRKVEPIANANTFTIGSIAGVMVWFVILSINSAQGKVNAPWTQGFPTLISSIIAFIVYGVIATYTIKAYGYEESRRKI